MKRTINLFLLSGFVLIGCTQPPAAQSAGFSDKRIESNESPQFIVGMQVLMEVPSAGPRSKKLRACAQSYRRGENESLSKTVTQGSYLELQRYLAREVRLAKKVIERTRLPIDGGSGYSERIVVEREGDRGTYFEIFRLRKGEALVSIASHKMDLALEFEKMAAP